MKLTSVRCLAIASIIALSGCATAHLHFGGPEAQKRTTKMGKAPRYVFAGTQANAQDLAILLPGNTSGDALYDGLTRMFFFIPLIDLPLCVVADTMFLPYDIYKVTLGGKTRYNDEDGTENKVLENIGTNAPNSQQ
jgi:uncharacterized protein YceK